MALKGKFENAHFEAHYVATVRYSIRIKIGKGAKLCGYVGLNGFKFDADFITGELENEYEFSGEQLKALADIVTEALGQHKL